MRAATADEPDADVFLSRPAIAKLCGSRIRASQIAWLRQQGIKFWVNLRGIPVVPRSSIDGAPAPAVRAGAGEWTPAVVQAARKPARQ